MSSDEVDKKNVEENTKDTASSAEENEEKDDTKEEKVNNKQAAKKKAVDSPKIKQPAKKRVKTEQAEKESKKEDKKEEKKKAAEVKEENENEEESAEENDIENHKAVPLLDQPLEISGSRKRKEVQRFKPVEPDEENKEVKIPEGRGKPLGEIARIEFNIMRAKPEDLKLLHRLCFGKPGKMATVKKTIKKFKGFEFEESSEEFEKKKAHIEKSCKKVTVAHLRNICNIIDVEKNGNKDDILERIIQFIACPVDSGKKLPGGGRSKRSGASAKNYDEGEESFKSKRKGKGKKKEEEDTEKSENEKDETEEEEEEEEEEVKENNKKKDDSQTTEESEEEEEKPKKGAKKGKKAATEAADKKAPPKKRAAAKKAAEKKSDSEGAADGDDESEDEEPLAKKAKTPPTDEEIKTYVKSLLEGADLELITMKKVCQDVYAHYPDFDLGNKKDFIKTTVKSLISS